MLDDGKLIDLALEKNQRAWRELVNRYYGKVHATVYRISGSRDESEDIAQEVFIELAKSLKNFRREAQFSTFVYRVSVNTAYRLLKNRENRSFVTDAIDFLSNMFTGKNSEKSPFEILKGVESIGKINVALKQLSVEKRAAIVLFEVEGIPLKDIAQIFKLPLQTIWSRVYNGRKDLLHTLKKKDV